jgi:hypothetical protein
MHTEYDNAAEENDYSSKFDIGEGIDAKELHK